MRIRANGKTGFAICTDTLCYIAKIAQLGDYSI